MRLLTLLNMLISAGERRRRNRCRSASVIDMPVSEICVREIVSPLGEDDEVHSRRVEAAMSLTDDDTFGYLLMVLKKPHHEAPGTIHVSGYVQDEWWPGFAEVARRVRMLARERIER